MMLQKKLFIILGIILLFAGSFFITVLSQESYALVIDPCGNGYLSVDDGEECDDGNLVNGDGCNESCEQERCGDGVVNNNDTEECDDGNENDTDACLSSCMAAVCGDGLVWSGNEECDDGNTKDGDGCNSACEIDRVWVDDKNDCDGNPYCYSSINNAIKSISSGVTVFVYNGTYIECVTVDKSIDLIGESQEGTIIYADEECTNILRLSADDIKVENFSLVGDNDNAVYAFGDLNNIKLNNLLIDNKNEKGIYVNGTDISISNSIIKNTCSGIYFESVEKASIYNNIIESNGLNESCDRELMPSTGIDLDDVIDANIYNNTIQNNDVGIVLFADCDGDGSISINKNIISGNNGVVKVVDGYGVESRCGDDNLDATYNYWGSKDGPAGVGDGSGDAVSDYVLYSPWYGDESFVSFGGKPSDTETGEKSLDIADEMIMISDGITVNIPAGVSITATGTWDGNIDAPTIKSSANVEPSRDGYSISMGTIVEMGSSDKKLLFDKAVKVLIPNEAGKLVGYAGLDGIFYEITDICGENSQAWADTNLATEGDCKVDSGDDLVVWTKHFTQFITYTQTVNPSTTPGGGGGSIGNNNPPESVTAINVPLELLPSQEGRLDMSFSGGEIVRLFVSRGAVESKTKFMIDDGIIEGEVEGYNFFENKYFDINAEDDGGEVKLFKKDINIEIYAPGADEYKSPEVYYYNKDKEWEKIKQARYDNEKLIFNFSVGHLSRFAVGEKIKNKITEQKEDEAETSMPQVLGVKKFADGVLVRGSSKKIYYIDKGFKYYVRSYNELKQKYSGQEIFDVSDESIASYEEKILPEEFADGTLIRGDDEKIYLIINGKKEHVRTLEELGSYAGQEILYFSE